MRYTTLRLLSTGFILSILSGCGENVPGPIRLQSDNNASNQTIDIPLSLACSIRPGASPESKVPLEVEVRNISQLPCSVSYKNPPSDFVISVFDSDGHIVEQTSEGKRYQEIAKASHDFKAIFVSSVALTLKPQEAIKFQIQLGSLYAVTKSGEYCVIVRKLMMVRDMPIAIGASAKFVVGMP
jgi:hypothetical protein